MLNNWILKVASYPRTLKFVAFLFVLGGANEFSGVSRGGSFILWLVWVSIALFVFAAYTFSIQREERKDIMTADPALISLAQELQQDFFASWKRIIRSTLLDVQSSAKAFFDQSRQSVLLSGFDRTLNFDIRGREIFLDDKLIGTLDSDAIEVNVASGTITNLSVYGNVKCGDVRGRVTAGHVSANYVSGNIHADDVHVVNDVAGDVIAGGDVTCGDVSGTVRADGDVTCGDVGEDVSGADVHCADVSGDISADGNVTATTANDINAGGVVTVQNIEGDIECQNINVTGNINGDVEATNVSCNVINGSVTADQVRVNR